MMHCLASDRVFSHLQSNLLDISQPFASASLSPAESALSHDSIACGATETDYELCASLHVRWRVPSVRSSYLSKHLITSFVHRVFTSLHTDCVRSL